MKFTYPIYRGILFNYPHGLLAVNKQKSMMVRAKNFHSMVNKYLLLIENKHILGIIKVIGDYKINIDQFKKLKKYHTLTENERKLWWPKKKELYAFPFVLVKKFIKAIKIDYKSGPRVFIKPENIIYV